jgi:hypothetical protein
MKNWKQNGMVIIAIIALVFASIACDDKSDTHTHEWGNWEETTPATYPNNNGVETRICLKCSEKETRPVTFQSYFYGIWIYNSFIIEINANKYDFRRTGTDYDFILVNLIWTTSSNPTSSKDTHLDGYKITGIVSEKNDNNTLVDIGNTSNQYIFFNPEKTSVYFTDDGNIAMEYAVGPFVRQE